MRTPEVLRGHSYWALAGVLGAVLAGSQGSPTALSARLWLEGPAALQGSQCGLNTRGLTTQENLGSPSEVCREGR